MDIQEQLQTDLKQAMRSGDRQRVSVIRAARAALQNAQLEIARQQYDEAAREIETRLAHDPAARDEALASIAADAHAPLAPDAQQAVLTKEVKRRRDTAEMYRNAGQLQRADEEEAEAHILEAYLPRQLSADELRPEVSALIEEMGLHGPGDMGKLMPVLMERFKGRAEGKVVSQVARELLKETQA